MEIAYRDILLRDRREQDIADWIRWNTVQTQWTQWDAPWEAEESDAARDPAAYRTEQLARLSNPAPEPRVTMELETGGVHIGWVSSYWMDRDCNWIARDALCPGQEAFLVLGLDICESRFWSRGLGKRALTAWILYFLQNGTRDLYLQTWSGRLAMIRVAERLGFREFRRKTAQRLVREERYDGLTFRLELASFGRYLLEENLRDLRLSAGTERNVGEAYDKRPGFYAAWAETAYEGEAPDLPICRQSPMERLVFWCLHMTRARLQYQAKGVPDSVVTDTFSDIRLRADLYEAKHGKPGLSRADVVWFRHLHHGCIFQLGSLQFQLFQMIYLDEEGCGEAYMTFSPEQKKRLPPGAPVINVHVPKGADLSPDRVDEALHQAVDFFSTVFPEHQARAFLCYSWLLYPGLRELLPEGSRIAHFAARFQIIGQRQDASEAIRRIYGRRWPKKGEYPQNSRLQRAALGRFRCLGEACGILEIREQR